MIKYAAIARKLTIFGLILSHASLIFSHCPVLFGVVTRTMTNLTDIPGRLFPEQSVFPYDVLPIYRYHLTVGCQLLSATFAVLSYISGDLIFGVILLHICGQFDILANRIKLMLLENPKKFHILLKINIKHHCQLIRYYNLFIYLLQNN